MSKYESEPDFGVYPDADVIYDGDQIPSFLTQEDASLRIPGAQYRYIKKAKRILAEHTGDTETFLTPEEEFELAEKVQAGLTAQGLIDEAIQQGVSYDQELDELAANGRLARDKLIVCNLRFAAAVARRSMNIGAPLKESENYKGPRKVEGTYAQLKSLRSPYASLDDRMQVANEALIHAAEKFKPVISSKTGEPVRFTTFAAWSLQSRLTRDIPQSEGNGFRVPDNVLEAIRLAKKDSSYVTPEKLENLRFTDIRRDHLSFEALEATFLSNEEQEGWGETLRYGIEDVITKEEEMQAEEVSEVNALNTKVYEILSSLSEREMGIIVYRFGLFGLPAKTLDQIGDIFGITRERVRQIESKTMAKLRHPSRSDVLKDFLEESSPNYVDTVNLAEQHYGIGHVALAYTDEPSRLFEPGMKDEEEEVEEVEATNTGWRYDLNEDWDLPVRSAPEFLDDEIVMARLADLITPDLFVRGGSSNPSYDHEAIEAIMESMQRSLRPRHIEEYWNEHLPAVVDELLRNRKQISYEAISLFFSRMLVETMTDHDVISLTIPDALQEKLNHFAYGLRHGHLEINGSLGDYAADHIGGLAHITVNGSVGDYAAAYADGFADLKVLGDAGRQFAFKVSGENDIRCHGKAISILPDIRFTGEIHVKQLERPTPVLPRKAGVVYVG